MNSYEQNQKGYQSNLNFHITQKECVSAKIHQHIQNWQNYKLDSKEIKQFYQDLERDHTFVQWIFPNFYNSMANRNSYRLSIQERNNMIEQKHIMDFYFMNYKMFLKFFGIQWSINKLVLENEKQFKQCLYTNTHNQLRLQRIFASLSVLGKREEAIKLLEFIYEHANKLYFSQYYWYDLVKEEKERNLNGQNDANLIDQSLNEQSKDIEHQKLTEQELKQQQIKSEHKIQSTQGLQKSTVQLETQQQIQSQQHKISQTISQISFQDQKQKDQLISNQKKDSISKGQEAQQKIKNANQTQQTYERQSNIYSFKQVKKQYVQGDLVNEIWVTMKLLTKEKA